LLIWELRNVRRLDRLLGCLFIVHGLRVLFHVCVELTLCEWPSVPAIKVKQTRCRQMDWSISLHYLLGRFIEEGYLKHQVIQTGKRRNKLMMQHGIKIKFLNGELQI
jgi:hypothetical protein